MTTLFWRDQGGNTLAETDASGNAQNNYIFLNGAAIGRSDVANGRVDYSYLHDHLGTTRMIVDATGHVCYDADYFPFGWEQAVFTNTCAQNYKFTGKERDPNTGLDYFGARWYAATIARFMTPDWSGSPVPVPYADLTDPQTLNLYSYVRNNPLGQRDADGHCAEDACIVEGGVTAGILAYGAVVGATAYLSTPSGQRSVETFTSAAGAAISNSFQSLASFFAKDAEAGQLQKAGKDAIDQSSTTIEKASRDLERFKNQTDVKQHIEAQQKGIDRVSDLSNQLDKAKGRSERDNIKAQLKEEIEKLKNHDRDLKTKPKKE